MKETLLFLFVVKNQLISSLADFSNSNCMLHFQERVYLSNGAKCVLFLTLDMNQGIFLKIAAYYKK